MIDDFFFNGWLGVCVIVGDIDSEMFEMVMFFCFEFECLFGMG